MSKSKMRWWGNGKQEKLIFELTLWKLRLSLWREVKPPKKKGV